MCLYTVYFSSQSENNEGRFALKTKYIQGGMLASVGGIFMKFCSLHSPRMRYKRRGFGCDGSQM